MKTPFSGGCACGAIRYETSSEPVMMFKCHCRNCQQMTGSGFSPAVIFPAEAFRITRGELRYHLTDSSGGGRHRRGFCAQCGSLVTGGENTERPTGIIGVTAGTLDDPSLFRPQMDIFVSDAQPWDFMDPALPKFSEYPPLEGST